MIAEHGPVLIILMPLAAALLISITALRRGWLAHSLATAGAAVSALFLLEQALAGLGRPRGTGRTLPPQ